MFTTKEAETILKNKKLPINKLKNDLKTKPIKQIAKENNIGYDRLLKIIKTLNITTNKNEKISQKIKNTKQQTITELLQKINKNQLEKELLPLTKKQLQQKYNCSKNNLEIIIKHYNLTYPTNNQKRIHKENTEIKQEIQKLLKNPNNHNLKTIQQHFKNTKYSTKRIQHIIAETQPEIIQQHEQQKHILNKNEQQSKENAIITNIRKDIYENLTSYTKAFHKNSSNRTLFKTLQNKIYLSPEDKQILNWLRNNQHKNFNNNNYIFNVKIPERFKKHQEHYKIYAIQNIPIETKKFLQNNEIFSVKEFNELILSQNPEKTCKYFNENDLKKFLCSKPTSLEKTINNMTTKINSDLKEFFVKNDFKNIQEVCDYFSISKDKVREVFKEIGFTPKFYLSEYEYNMDKFLSELGIDYVVNSRALSNKQEIDFYFPDKKIGIEVSPLHTHNASYGLGKRKDLALNKNYHYNKFIQSEKDGILLIQLFEKDLTGNGWLKSKDFIKFKLLGASRIFYGRQITIREIKNTKIVKNFCENYHLNGYVSSKFKYGFYFEDELLGVATFSPYGVEKDYLELKRLVFLPDVQIRFGLSKLCAYIEKEFSGLFKGIVSFSHNDIGRGEGYEKAGFELVKYCKPSVSFVNPLDPCDSYSWQVATPWGAKSGVIAKKIKPMNIDHKEALRIVIEELPHRSDSEKGYIKFYNSGNKKWLRSFV